MARLNWGRALTGVGENIGQMIELKQRDKEMAWEEARAIRLENLRARNVKSADERRAGYRLTEIAATGDVSMAVAEQSNEWAVENAALLHTQRLAAEGRTQDRFISDELRKNAIALSKAQANLIALREREFMSIDNAMADAPDAGADGATFARSMFEQTSSGGYRLTQDGFDRSLLAIENAYAYADASLTLTPEKFKDLQESISIAGSIEYVKVAISELTKSSPTVKNLVDSLGGPAADKEERERILAAEKAEAAAQAKRDAEAERKKKGINQTTITPELSPGGFDLSVDFISPFSAVETGEDYEGVPPPRPPKKKLRSPTSPGEYREEFIVPIR